MCSVDVVIASEADVFPSGERPEGDQSQLRLAGLLEDHVSWRHCRTIVALCSPSK